VNSPLRILVATDGSEPAQHAVTWSADFARTTGAEIVLAHTVSKVGEWLMSIAQIDFVKVEEERRGLLEGAWAKPLKDAEVPYRTRFLTGDPIATLVETAEQEDVDFIVIGKTGHGGPGHGHIGGSAAKLSQRSTRPLMLVP
jgi:nucleotide-binding universal stress UspA family protein